MHADERLVIVEAGDGGDGVVAWKREKAAPRGGPGGGNGGRGGSVLLVADSQMTTFLDMEQDRVFRAASGERGGGNCRQGRSAGDRTVGVPLGTTIYDAEGNLLADLVEPGQVFLAARGGRGGRGNSEFATALDQRPARAEEGEPGERRRLTLQLRVLAEVGLVGLPNAGKSTLLARISRATPRIAAYPFTTLEPCLGVVDLPSGRRVVVADLPGLVEGAHRGKGLGHRFLRHTDRTRVLVHLVDLHPDSGPRPGEAWRTVRAELETHGRGLDRRAEVLVASKVDRSPSPVERAEALRSLAAEVDREPVPVSALSGEGLPALLAAVEAALEAAPEAPGAPGAIPPPPREEAPGSPEASSPACPPN